MALAIDLFTDRCTDIQLHSIIIIAIGMTNVLMPLLTRNELYSNSKTKRIYTYNINRLSIILQGYILLENILPERYLFGT